MYQEHHLSIADYSNTSNVILDITIIYSQSGIFIDFENTNELQVLIKCPCYKASFSLNFIIHLLLVNTTIFINAYSLFDGKSKNGFQ